MKPPRLPDLRKLLAGLAATRADGAVLAPDEQLRELERRLQCRARQTRERRVRKLMGPPEPPERALTVRAMEQIRYLRRAFPEEWPPARLAQGFGVTPEEIRRVLRSRFRPSPERGLEQDARVAPRRERPVPPPAGNALPACRAGPAPPSPRRPPGPTRTGARAGLLGRPAEEPLEAASRPFPPARRRPAGARG